MSKVILYLVSILLTIIVGSILFYNYCSNCGGKSRNLEPAITDTSIVIDDQSAYISDPAPDSSAVMDWQTVRDQLNANPLTIYFDPYQTESTLNQNDINLLGEIIVYLENNPDKSLIVNGYSDITGPRDLNMKLSQKRAVFLKDYFVRNGINTDKILLFSKGPDDPIADNNTIEGRAKNRRAVVIIN
ncbi:MAG: OmpA family protein [Bacteroidales bacterium]